VPSAALQLDLLNRLRRFEAARETGYVQLERARALDAPMFALELALAQSHC
jgi:hypothetical protein